MRNILMAACLFVVCVTTARAEGREFVGTSSLFTNDFIGDGGDRWRTGSFTYSHLRGYGAYDGQNSGFGDIIEYRLRTDIFAPAGGSAFPGDRPYATAVSLGVNTHFAQGDLLYTLGLEATAIGPQTGLSAIQEDFHERFSLPQPPFRGQELGDQWVLGTAAEMAHRSLIGDTLSLRSFAALAAGTETLARVGFDMRLAPYGHSDLMLRDVVTGQLHNATEDHGTGWAFTAGADVAYVSESLFLPESRVAGIENLRLRARAGVEYKFARDASVFYGATYLSPEFVGQSEGQVVGSLRLNFNF